MLPKYKVVLYVRAVTEKEAVDIAYDRLSDGREPDEVTLVEED